MNETAEKSQLTDSGAIGVGGGTDDPEAELRYQALRRQARALAHELDLFRQRRSVNVCDRFRGSFDAWELMHPAFQKLRDDSVLFCLKERGFRLLPGINLVRLPFMRYRIAPRRAGLKAILAAPIVDIPFETGEIIMRLKRSGGEVIAESTVAIDSVSGERPSRFEFPSVGSSSLEELDVHFCVRDVSVPVRLFELKRYRWLGLGRAERRGFFGFEFDDAE